MVESGLVERSGSNPSPSLPQSTSWSVMSASYSLDVDNEAWPDLISDHSVRLFVLRCRRVPCPTRPTSLPRQHQHHIGLVEAAAH